MARAMAFCEISIGLRYSSSKNSQGVMDAFIHVQDHLLRGLRMRL